MASYHRLHEWELSPKDAVALQRSLQKQIKICPLDRPITLVAGADLSFNRFEDTVYAGIVVISLPSLETVEEASITTTARFPYVPGLLSFREAPAILDVWEKLRCQPDALVLDGQGIAHPRRMGIASHLGLFVGLPTLGCAKSVLVGRYEEPPANRGAFSPMEDRGEIVGAALCTKNKVNPVYISPGHLIDLPGAIDLALRCDGGYRVPEPTRRAHLLVNARRRGEDIH
jgi:deoxyribonuclease V